MVIILLHHALDFLSIMKGDINQEWIFEIIADTIFM